MQENKGEIANQRSNLIINTRINDGTQKAPYQTTTNLSNIEKNDDEIAILV